MMCMFYAYVLACKCRCTHVQYTIQISLPTGSRAVFTSRALVFFSLIFLKFGVSCYRSTAKLNCPFYFAAKGVGASSAFSRALLAYIVMHTKAIVPGVCHGLKHCVSTIIVPLSKPKLCGFTSK